MDAVRFDTLARSLTAAGSRRRALAALSGALGLVLGASSVEDAAAKKKPCPPCKKRKKGKCKKTLPDGTACAGGACLSGSCVSTAPPPSPPVPVLTYQCSEPGEGSVSAGTPATTRFAQTFTAAQSGSLHQIQFLVFKPVGSTGDYLVELLAVADGKPTDTVLAQLSIPDTSVPEDSSTLTATFSGPPLVASTLYAAAISRPGGTDLTIESRTGNDCAGSVFSQDPSGSGTFTELNTSFEDDLVTSVIVLA